MAKTYKTAIRQSVAALLALGVGYSAGADIAKDVVAVGPVELVEASSITVLGRSYRMEDTSGIVAGDKVAVHGALQPDGSASSAWAEPLGTYTAGADPIYETGLVTALDVSAGQLSIGDSKVDYTAALAESGSTAPTVGQLVSVTGIQPVVGGVILGSTTNAGITGIRVALAGSTGARLAGVTGTGLNSSGVTGTGLNSSGVTGTGLNSSGVTGTGLNSSGVTGTGLNSSGVTGTGLNSSGVTGTGLNSSGVTGTGLNSSGVTGTGLNSSGVTGTGLNSSGVTGTGAASE
jgi:hypothetical protein